MNSRNKPEVAPTSHVYLPVYPVAPNTMHSYSRFVCAIVSQFVSKTSIAKLPIVTFAISNSGRTVMHSRLSLQVLPQAIGATSHGLTSRGFGVTSEYCLKLVTFAKTARALSASNLASEHCTPHGSRRRQNTSDSPHVKTSAMTKRTKKVGITGMLITGQLFRSLKIVIRN